MYSHRFLMLATLLCTWLIWGSTYLAIRIGVEQIPPLLMAAVRFLLAGGAMFIALRLRGQPSPSRQEWANAALVGFLMLTVGNGAVTWAEQSVSSGMAAMVVAIVPLLTVWFSRLLGYRPAPSEWIGIALGLGGMLVLSTSQQLQASPGGTALLLIAACAWAVASALSPRLALPDGAMSAATQMLIAGTLLAILGLIKGERLTHLPGQDAILAVLYLALFGSVIAYSAFAWLLRNASPALASSYAYVNPPVAVLLGWLLADEAVSQAQWFAMPLVCIAVLFVARSRHR